MSKTKKQTAAERVKRRANIRRGIRIGLYEMRQALGEVGIDVKTPPWFIGYTCAIAEAGRRGATAEDHRAAHYWGLMRDLYELSKRA